MKIIDLDKILASSLYKPTRYHYLCYDGGFKMIDTWGNQEKMDCDYSCHYKTNCGRTIKGSRELTRKEFDENAGMLKIINKIKNDKL